MENQDDALQFSISQSNPSDHPTTQGSDGSEVRKHSHNSHMLFCVCGGVGWVGLGGGGGDSQPRVSLYMVMLDYPFLYGYLDNFLMKKSF